MPQGPYCGRACLNGGMRLLNLIAHLLITGVALWATAALLPGMHLGDDAAPLTEQLLTIGAVALVFVVVDAVVKPVVEFFSLPLTCLTLGLFQLVVNTLMLLLTAWVSGLLGLTLSFDTFWWAMLAGILIGLVRALLDAVIRPAPREPRTRVLYQRDSAAGAAGGHAVYDEQGRRIG